MNINICERVTILAQITQYLFVLADLTLNRNCSVLSLNMNVDHVFMRIPILPKIQGKLARKIVTCWNDTRLHKKRKEDCEQHYTKSNQRQEKTQTQEKTETRHRRRHRHKRTTQTRQEKTQTQEKKARNIFKSQISSCIRKEEREQHFTKSNQHQNRPKLETNASNRMVKQ